MLFIKWWIFIEKSVQKEKKIEINLTKLEKSCIIYKIVNSLERIRFYGSI